MVNITDFSEYLTYFLAIIVAFLFSYFLLSSRSRATTRKTLVDNARPRIKFGQLKSQPHLINAFIRQESLDCANVNHDLSDAEEVLKNIRKIYVVMSKLEKLEDSLIFYVRSNHQHSIRRLR